MTDDEKSTAHHDLDSLSTRTRKSWRTWRGPAALAFAFVALVVCGHYVVDALYSDDSPPPIVDMFHPVSAPAQGGEVELTSTHTGGDYLAVSHPVAVGDPVAN